MDIIDIILANALSPKGQADTAVAQAQQSAARAIEAAETATEIATDLETNLNSIINNKITEVTDPIENSISDINTSLNTAVATIELEDNNSTNVKIKKINVTKKNNSEESFNIVKNYTSTGNNEDGSMTQKAISTELNNLSAAISELNTTAGNTGINLGSANKNKIVIVNNDGSIVSGILTEEEIIQLLINEEIYNAEEAVGLNIDYVNKTTKRTQEAKNLNKGSDFDKYQMYGGRKRCIVNREGRIIAWYGDNNYIEDGSLGQVMIYQPKFYYNRNISDSEETIRGIAVKKETLMISHIAQPGFKIHPLFIDENGQEIDYVLLPAYESTYYDVSTNQIISNDGADIDFNNDYLMSVAGIKPISGVNKALTISNAEKLANNIGSGWHITNIAAESANQMLEIIEFGTLNGQTALEAGITKLQTNTGINGASITGSTSNLGNQTGAASNTTNEYNGTYQNYDTAGYRAISYRGFENPWGNIYRFIGGINIYGDGYNGSGIIYICKDFNYTPNENGLNYKNSQTQLAPTSSWISKMSYLSSDYDWIYLPIEAENANSLLPVGDMTWITQNLNGFNLLCIGGTQRQDDNCGLFYYACNQNYNKYSSSISARIMHIPTKNSAIYEANIAAWNLQMGE